MVAFSYKSAFLYPQVVDDGCHLNLGISGHNKERLIVNNNWCHFWTVPNSLHIEDYYRRFWQNSRPSELLPYKSL